MVSNNCCYNRDLSFSFSHIRDSCSMDMEVGSSQSDGSRYIVSISNRIVSRKYRLFVVVYRIVSYRTKNCPSISNRIVSNRNLSRLIESYRIEQKISRAYRIVSYRTEICLGLSNRIVSRSSNRRLD